MAAGNSRNSRPGSSPKRTPRVAGRNAPRVSVANREAGEKVVEEKTSATTAVTSGVERKRRAAAAKAAEAEAVANVDEPGAPPRDTAATLRLAAVLAAIAVVLGVIATIFAFHPGAKQTDNRAFVDKTQTEEVLAQARTAVCSSFNFDFNNLDRWADDVRSKFTGQALAEYEKVLKANRDIVKQARSASDCQVDVVGVQTMTDDTATVVASMIVSTSVNGVVQRKEVGFGQFDFEKVDDDWLVNKVSTL